MSREGQEDMTGARVEIHVQGETMVAMAVGTIGEIIVETGTMIAELITIEEEATAVIEDVLSKNGMETLIVIIGAAVGGTIVLLIFITALICFCKKSW